MTSAKVNYFSFGCIFFSLVYIKWLPLQQNNRIMADVAGIKYIKSSNGGRGFVRIDLDTHGDNELLEDFLDLVDIKARMNEPTCPLHEVIARENKRRGLL
jgi:hypothetical protein